MTAVQLKERKLGDLLTGLVKAQRQDIDAYSKGHLNPAKLKLPPELATRKTWKSAQKKPISANEKSKPLQGKKHTEKEENMKDAIMNFSVGTTGALSFPPVAKKKVTKQKKVPSSLRNEWRGATSHSLEEGYERRTNVLVEELELPDKMVPSPRTNLYRPKTWAAAEESDSPPSQAELKDRNLAQRLKHKFVPSQLDGVTKKDQFRSFKAFESDILRKQDALEQNVLSGFRAVEHLERRLQQELDSLQYNGYGPNFHRLQIYSNVLDDLASDSPTFCHILNAIKGEYDHYISALLDGQSSRHQVLYDQVDQMSAKSSYMPNVLSTERQKVERFEQEAKKQLLANDRLREELKTEVELSSQDTEEPVKKTQVRREEVKPDLVEEIEQLRCDILTKRDSIAELRHKLRQYYVPSTVVQHLEQCIKETEVDIQKLASQQEYFDRSMSELETELETAIQDADTTDRDSKRAWKKVSQLKGLTPSRTLRSTMDGKLHLAKPLDDDSTDEDDDRKWDWYIS